jgi:hypothetical protein
VELSEETRRKSSISHKGQPAWNKGIPCYEETKRKLSERKKGTPPWNTGLHRSKECRDKISIALRGEKSPAWKGGISFEPYCEKFNEALKESVRVKFNRTCYLCPTTESETSKKLSIHHNDYNKMQGCGKRPWNLIPLCHKCHSKTNHNRWYWFSLLYNYWALNPEINF